VWVASRSIGCRTFRATGITAYLETGSTLKAEALASMVEGAIVEAQQGVSP
jgi:hypothetical protein